MRTALVTWENNSSDYSLEENFKIAGQNSGNNVFKYSLERTLDVTPITHKDFYEKADEFDNFIITDLIWIREGAEYPWLFDWLKKIGDKPLIPVSAGLQSGDFNPHFEIQKNTVLLLKEISERCTIGVRGAYTAEIFEKHGIKNLSIIGCPSLYLENKERHFSRSNMDEIKKINCNFRTFWNLLSKKDEDFLSYCANREASFIEQTNLSLKQEFVNHPDNFMKFNEWMERKQKIFFNVEEWIHFMKDFDFSIGERFHGNVISLLAGVPALFISIDSRTREMCDYFSLPYIGMNDFDDSKPLSYYYELADYTAFNKNYIGLLDHFISFCIKNKIGIRGSLDAYYERKFAVLSERIIKLEEAYH